MPRTEKHNALASFISAHRADLRLAWRSAAGADDVAVMHVTEDGQQALVALAECLADGAKPPVIRKLLATPPWSGNEGGADSPTAMLLALTSALREAAGSDAALISAVNDVTGIMAVQLDAATREHVRQLEHRIATDTLTGSDSRTTILDHLKVESARSVRHGRPLSVVYLDVVGLKKVNDGIGHPAGDVMLRKLVNYVERNTRASDRIGRLGGDEFLVLLPETDSEGASVVAKKLTAILADEGVRISAGVAGTPETNPDADALVAAADAALRSARLLRSS
jgi:diguanylate cyclase (GGDEF)-like protein